MKARSYANPFDRPVDGDELVHGDDLEPGTASAYRGMGWYMYFRDETGEVYRVRCTDGENYCRGPFSPANTQWVQRCYDAVVERTHAMAEAGTEEIRISLHEWRIMLHHTHRFWLDVSDKYDGHYSDLSRDEGLIGHIRGIPVIVDPSKEDEFPPQEPTIS